MGAFAFDGLSFVFSASCLFAIRPLVVSSQAVEDSLKKASTTFPLKGFVDDLHEGWRFVVRSPWFFIGLPLATLGSIFFSGPLEVALPKLVQTAYHADIWLFGVLGMALALGSILASLLLGQLRHIPKRGTVMYGPRDAQRVLPQQQSGLRAFFIASLFRGGGVKVTVTSRKVEPEERREPSSDLCIGK
jgi:hypothetical protein